MLYIHFLIYPSHQSDEPGVIMISTTQKREKKLREGQYHAQPATDLLSSVLLYTCAIQYHSHWLHVATYI